MESGCIGWLMTYFNSTLMTDLTGLLGVIAILWLLYEIVVNLATPPIYGKFPSLVGYLVERQ